MSDIESSYASSSSDDEVKPKKIKKTAINVNVSDTESEPDDDFSEGGREIGVGSALKHGGRKIEDGDYSDFEESEEEESDMEDNYEEEGYSDNEKNIAKKNMRNGMSDADDSGNESDDDDDIDDSEDYLKKFNENTKRDIIDEYYPEMHQHNYDEVEAMCRVVRDANGTIIDPLHRTLPFLTRYEKARILGERAKQINSGAMPLVQVDENVVDGYLIALKELDEKKIPFVIKRPLPNGGCEYWKLADLEIII